MSTSARRPASSQDERAQVLRSAAALGKRLGSLNGESLDEALTVIGEVRHAIDQIERDLVSLARRSGRSWAEIGADLGIIIPTTATGPVQDGIRYAPRRRSNGTRSKAATKHG